MRCPICEREFEAATSPAVPFCGDRCRLVDLGRWLGEGYAVPGDPTDDPEQEFGEPPTPGADS